MIYEPPQEYRPPELPRALPHTAVTVQWFGTAAFRVIYKNTTLLIDPYVSRPGMFRVGFLNLYCDGELCREHFPAADHIIIGHSHCDHLLDVPEIARYTGAVVHGSSSTVAVCRGEGLPPRQINEFVPNEPIPCGDLTATFVPSLHGKAVLNRIPYPGDIEGTPAPPLKCRDYKHGAVSGMLVQAGELRMMHLGSAALIDDELSKAGPVDVLMVGLAGRRGTPDFFPRLNKCLSPRFIVGHHYDNFFKPLDQAMTLNQGVNIESFFEEVRAAFPDARVILPAFLDTIAMDAATRDLIP